MRSTLDHTKEILLVEDLEEFYTPIARWLREKGYRVTLAKSYQEALSALDGNRYHLAIVDIRLKDEDETNEAGMDLLVDIEKKQLNEVMPCIVLTAYENIDNILTATQKRRVAGYIQKKAEYRTELLQAVGKIFDEKIKINFDLIYDGGSDELVPDIARDIRWSVSPTPQPAWLIPQIRDLFGSLFVKAERLHIAKLKPGLTGAAVVHVRPTWGRGLGPSFVAKIGPRDKVETERINYQEYVKQYASTITQVDAAHSRDVGALLYTFAESDTAPLDEFDVFYKRNQPQAIVDCLRNLFRNTCRYWYDARERIIEDLPQLYYKAFQLSQEKLVRRIRTVLPRFAPEHDTFRFNRIPIEVTNPIAWLAQHRHECVLPVYHSITHGDLTGRNIMVDEDGKCWLIDFFRTYDSHILRDFVILETDIKYRLLETIELKDFLLLEESLLETDQTEPVSSLNVNLPVYIQKAVQVITALRAVAYEFSHGPGAKARDSRQEYLISLLMTTLNVVRLRHIEKDRKLQAMLSATLICAELDKLAGREPFRPDFDEYL